MLTSSGLDALAAAVGGISVAKSLLLGTDPPDRFVGEARERGLALFAWTCRPENSFLLPPYRLAGGDAAFGDYRREWAVLREAGLDGVFVDHPELGVEFFRD